MADNLARLVNTLKEKRLDSLIVTNPTNIFYLSGFKGFSPTEREAILVIKRLNLDKGSNLTNYTATLITARLYQTEAKLLSSIKLKIKIVAERNQIYTSLNNALKDSKRAGFEQKNLTFDEYREFKKKLNPPQPSPSFPRKRESRTRAITGSRIKYGMTSYENSTSPNNSKLRLVPTKDIIENLRAEKTDEEIKKIETAQTISQKAFEQIINFIRIGQTEEEIASKLASIIKSLGGQGLAFESIIASGPNSGRPHYFTGERPIANGELLLMDFGAKFQDYCADLSRTIFIGKAKDSQKNIFNHVLKAQKAAISEISHGSKSHEIHSIASDIFKDQELHKYFLHGLGHGIGLEIHEKPHLRPLPKEQAQSKPHSAATPEVEELTENMVFSVEPGLYFDWGGIRTEDLVVIKNGKARILGKTQEQIIEI